MEMLFAFLTIMLSNRADNSRGTNLYIRRGSFICRFFQIVLHIKKEKQ